MRSLRLLPLLAAILLLPVSAANGTPPARIVGGADTAIETVPWQAALLHSSNIDTFQGQFCGAVIRDANTIITAGHCVTDNAGDPVAASSIDVLAGTDTLGDGSGQRIHVSAITVDPNFDRSALSNDVALLTLSSPITLSANAQPIGLVQPTEMDSLTGGAALTVSGWGNTTTDPPGTPNYPTHLKSVDVPFVTNAACADDYGAAFDASTMFCAGQTGKDSCSGDSGGPIIRSFSGTPKLLGLVSWGYGCATNLCPGAYSRMADQSIHDFVMTGTASTATPADPGSGDGYCVTGLPPGPPPPGPPAVDTAAPVVTLRARLCKKRVCTVRVSVSDPAPSSGLRGLSANVTSTISRRCGSRHKTCSRTVKTRLAPVRNSQGYTIVTRKLTRGKHVMTLSIGDISGHEKTKRMSLHV